MEVTRIDILLAEYTSGDADATESAAAENWIAASETNKAYAASLRAIWEQSLQTRFTGTVDEKAAFQKFRQRMDAEKK